MAANTRFPAWTDAEIDTLILRYRAGDYWRDIVTAVCAASGHQRSKDACRKKAADLNLTVGRTKGHNRVDIDADLEDLIVLGYDKERIAEELGVCTRTVYEHIKTLPAEWRRVWSRHARARQHQGLEAGRRPASR